MGCNMDFSKWRQKFLHEVEYLDSKWRQKFLHEVKYLDFHNYYVFVLDKKIPEFTFSSPISFRY